MVSYSPEEPLGGGGRMEKKNNLKSQQRTGNYSSLADVNLAVILAKPWQQTCFIIALVSCMSLV